VKNENDCTTKTGRVAFASGPVSTRTKSGRIAMPFERKSRHNESPWEWYFSFC